MSDKTTTRVHTLQELREWVASGSQVYRPIDSDEVTVREIDGLRVTEINSYPDADAGDPETVDVMFLQIAPATGGTFYDWTGAELYDTIVHNDEGEFGTIMGLERWKGGPNYMEIGGWLGSQDLALRLLALGQLKKLWQVMTPAVLGITGEDARQMAGMGFVMAGGITRPAD